MDLLISPDGMLGRAWKTLLEARAIPFEGVSYPAFDLTAPDALQRIESGKYTRVINCAAWTDVDGAEAKEAEATELNGHAVGRLAQRCAEAGSILVHYSTDYVFGGDATEPYPVDGPYDPVNAYGRSKMLGEIAIRDSGALHLILRTSWLYAPWGGRTSCSPCAGSGRSVTCSPWSTTSAAAPRAPGTSPRRRCGCSRSGLEGPYTSPTEASARGTASPRPSYGRSTRTATFDLAAPTPSRAPRSAPPTR